MIDKSEGKHFVGIVNVRITIGAVINYTGNVVVSCSLFVVVFVVFIYAQLSSLIIANIYWCSFLVLSFRACVGSSEASFPSQHGWNFSRKIGGQNATVISSQWENC